MRHMHAIMREHSQQYGLVFRNNALSETMMKHELDLLRAMADAVTRRCNCVAVLRPIDQTSAPRVT